MARCADILVDSILSQGSEIGFGVPGESYLAVLDAFYDRERNFRFITARHEGGAGFMAEAYGKLTGRPGLCFVTRGPGATNAAIAVHTAMQNSTPMILFVGQIRNSDRDREAFQELDYRQVFGPIAKWVTELDNPDRAAELVRRAYNVAQTGRPGPVVIALPENVLRMETNAQAAGPVRFPKMRVHEEDLSDAQSLYQAAKKPLVIVGGGGWSDEDRAALDDWARRTSTPVLAGFRYQDLINYDHSSFIGDAGVGMPASSKTALSEADLIISVNMRFGEMLTDAWSIFEGRDQQPKIIHLHRDPSEINKIYPADVALTGAPGDIFKALGDHPNSENWASDHREAFFAIRQNDPDAFPMASFCRVLNSNLPQDAIVTNGAGNFAAWPSRHIDFGQGRRLVAPQSGAMGAGLPAAVAAKLIYPDRHVLCFAGDGDIQMTGAELATAEQFDAKPNLLIVNNGALGTIQTHQSRDFPDRVSGTVLQNPDFVAWAKSFNFDAEHIEKSGNIDLAATDAAKRQGLVVEIKC